MFYKWCFVNWALGWWIGMLEETERDRERGNWIWMYTCVVFVRRLWLRQLWVFWLPWRLQWAVLWRLLPILWRWILFRFCTQQCGGTYCCRFCELAATRQNEQCGGFSAKLHLNLLVLFPKRKLWFYFNVYIIHTYYTPTHKLMFSLMLFSIIYCSIVHVRLKYHCLIIVRISIKYNYFNDLFRSSHLKKSRIYPGWR